MYAGMLVFCFVHSLAPRGELANLERDRDGMKRCADQQSHKQGCLRSLAFNRIYRPSLLAKHISHRLSSKEMKRTSFSASREAHDPPSIYSH